LCLSGTALAQTCPAGQAGVDGFTTIALPTVEFKYRIGTASTEIQLSKTSPLSGEIETQRHTVFQASSDGPTSGLLQTNDYSFDLENFSIDGKVGAAIGAGYTNGALDIGYGAEEGKFLALLRGSTGQLECYSYPERATFGDWTKAISVVDLSFLELQEGLTRMRGDLASCRADVARLSSENAALRSENAALKAEIARLNASLQAVNAANSRTVYDLRKLFKSLYKEAEGSLKRENAENFRAQLRSVRKLLVKLSKGNGRNVGGRPDNLVRRSTNNSL